MPQKQFDKWNEVKKERHDAIQKAHCHTREIWFTHLGENVGFEQNGQGKEFLRPILILKKFNTFIFLTIPLTTQEKKGKYYFHIKNSGGKEAWAILSQIRLLDSRRLKYKVGELDTATFKEIKKAISEILLSDDDF